MGLRYRTPIGTLRDQRRRAEELKIPEKVTASQLRVRALDSLHGAAREGKDRQKSLELLERLRQALQDDSSQSDAAQEYSSLQDELARVHIRQKAGQETPPSPQDIPMDAYRPSTQPFSLVIVAADEKQGFPKRIRRLESPLSNFDSYLPASPAPEAPASSRVLSLAPEAGTDAASPKDHSDHAAELVQDAMNKGPKADLQIPASLALSLLND